MKKTTKMIWSPALHFDKIHNSVLVLVSYNLNFMSLKTNAYLFEPYIFTHTYLTMTLVPVYIVNIPDHEKFLNSSQDQLPHQYPDRSQQENLHDSRFQTLLPSQTGMLYESGFDPHPNTTLF